MAIVMQGKPKGTAKHSREASFLGTKGIVLDLTPRLWNQGQLGGR